jgi:hypothetical protein
MTDEEYRLCDAYRKLLCIADPLDVAPCRETV